MTDLNISEEKAKTILEEAGITELLKKGNEGELQAMSPDLARLYILIRERKPFSVLEFGSGFSTIVIAFALRQNWQEYLDKCGNEPKFEKPQFISLETSAHWRQNTSDKMKSLGLDDFSDIRFSEVHIGEHNGQICHFYKDLPDIVPDFVYLDGPDPATVQGDINGITFKNPKRTVLAGDLLKYESTLLPGFFMIVDGRTNNCRFLERNFTRNFDMTWHKESDVTTFELNEDRLGRKNILGREAYGA